MPKVISNNEVEYFEDLFDCVPEEHKTKFIDQCISNGKNEFFIYGTDTIEYKSLSPDEDDLNPNDHIFVKTKICKTKYCYTTKLDIEVYFNLNVNGKELIHNNFKYRGKNVFRIEDVSNSLEDCYDSTVRHILEDKRSAEFNKQQKECNMKSSNNGRVSDEGWKYFNDYMDKACKNDPGGAKNMRLAIWFTRKEMKQRFRSISISIENAAKKYNVTTDLLYSRFQTNIAVWKHAKTK